MNKSTSLSQVGSSIVLTLEDYSRIKSRNDTHSDTRKQDREKEQLDRKQLRQKIHNWPNTIFSLMKEKDSEKYKKFEREQLARREVEKDEEYYRRRQGEMVIKAAKYKIRKSEPATRVIDKELFQQQTNRTLDRQVEFKQHKKAREYFDRQNQRMAQNMDLERVEEERIYQKEEILRKQKVVLSQIAAGVRAKKEEAKQAIIAEKLELSLQRVREEDQNQRMLRESQMRRAKSVELMQSQMLEIQAKRRRQQEQAQLERVQLARRAKEHAAKEEKLNVLVRRAKAIREEKERLKEKRIEIINQELTRKNEERQATLERIIKKHQNREEELHRLKEKQQLVKVKEMKNSLIVAAQKRKEEAVLRKQEEQAAARALLQSTRRLEQLELEQHELERSKALQHKSELQWQITEHQARLQRELRGRLQEQEASRVARQQKLILKQRKIGEFKALAQRHHLDAERFQRNVRKLI